MTSVRVRAPQFPIGATWFNTGERAQLLGELRGRFVLLDFWTFCCGNCLHVLDELRPLEAKFADILTVIGVHSPKFAHEAEDGAVAAAIERHEVRHPVVNDPAMYLWQQYAVRAWPTLVLIDPQGYVVAQAAGEGQVSALDASITRLAAEHEARGTLRHGDGPYVASLPQPSTLRFPAKAILLPAERTGRDSDSLLVADAGHHQLVELALDGETELRRIGSTDRCSDFAEPNGLTLLPFGLVDYDVLVADTANHVLRGLRLSDDAMLPNAMLPNATMTTIDLAAALAGARTITGPIPNVLSPWDVAWWPALDRAVVAAAGVHLLLALDVRSGQVEVLAGTTVEGLKDGPARAGWLAQPSGLAVDGDRLWFVDAETSALRTLTADGRLHTVIGEGLFDFGHVDGPAADARLQHPLGVTLLPDASVAVLDTYNGAVRRYDPATGQVSTLARDLGEPSGAVLVGGELIVVESGAHRLVRPVPRSDLVAGPALRTQRPSTDVVPGPLRLEVVFQPAPGRTLDERYGPSARLSVSASPPELLQDGAGETTGLRRVLTLAPAPAEGVLHIGAQAASCDSLGEHAACYVARQDWGVPVRVVEGGAGELQLVLLD